MSSGPYVYEKLAQLHPHRGGELLPYDHEAYSLSGARRELL
jgi:hypothetical protein